MSAILSIFIATFLVNLVAFAGIATLSFKRAFLDKILILLISLSAGTLLGDSLLHLLPESVEEAGGFTTGIGLLVASGIICFFILEKFILWHHHHTIETPKEHENHQHAHESCHLHSLRMVNLVGDAFHNLLDGMIIAGSFFISPTVGISTTIAVFLHEIPQEISDFGVLIHTGLSTKKALLYNFLSGVLALVGAGLGILLGNASDLFLQLLIPFTAGAFIYISASDLIPELRKTNHFSASFLQLSSLILGILIMLGLLFIE